MDSSYNNSLGNNGASIGPEMPSSVISSRADDIVLPEYAAKKKSKNKWILIGIGGFVIVVLLIVLLVLFLMPKNNIDDDRTIESYVNEYLNLFATGEESDEPIDAEKLTVEVISNEELTNIYTMPRFYDSYDEKNVDYYNKLISLLIKIEKKNTKEKYSEEQKDRVALLVDDLQKILPYYFIAVALAYTDSCYDYYFENYTLAEIFAVYGYPFEDIDDTLLRIYSGRIDRLYNVKASFYNSAVELGCSDANGIDYVCLSGLDSGEIAEMQNDNSQLTSMEEDDAEELLVRMSGDATGIYEIFNRRADE